jgi:amino acid transporter
VENPRVLITTNTKLTFISFWRSAAIVLVVVLSSAFFIGGSAERALGAASPWYIIGVLIFSRAVAAIYLEAGSRSVRDGYQEIKSAIGDFCGKLASSILLLDYILIGPLRGLIAGSYIVTFLNELMTVMAQSHWLPTALTDEHDRAYQLDVSYISTLFAAAVTIYCWWQNIKGIKESSDKALRVMQITTVMVIILFTWGIYSATVEGAHLPPLPTLSNLHFSDDALGFLKSTRLVPLFGIFGVLIAFGHSILAMSGEESLAQVNREIEHPKLRNLKRVAIVIAIYSLIFTGGVTLLASMLVPDAVRVNLYRDNLIAGLAMYLAGPLIQRIVFRIFVVLVGILILSGGVRLSILNSTNFTCRIAEDGLLPDWLRRRHPSLGTPYRAITIIALLQILIVAMTGHDPRILVEACSFSVIWTFAFRAGIVLVNRLKDTHSPEFRVPFNLTLGNIHVPLGVISITLSLIALAVATSLTQATGTVIGIGFILTTVALFSFYQRFSNQQEGSSRDRSETLSMGNGESLRETLAVRPGGVLVCLLDYNTLYNLDAMLNRVNTEHQDVVAAYFRNITDPLPDDATPSANGTLTATEERVLDLASGISEEKGKIVHFVVVATQELWNGIVQMGQSLEAESIVLGLFPRMSPREEFLLASNAWEELPEPKRQQVAYIYTRDSQMQAFYLGPHAPNLSPESVMLVHALWLRLQQESSLGDLDHQEVVLLALRRLHSTTEAATKEVMQELRASLEDIRDSKRAQPSKRS